MSADRLIEGIRKKKNPTVLGLDPQVEHLPPEILERHITEKGKGLEAFASAALEVNLILLDALADIVPSVKLQAACYEQMGPAGMETLSKSIAAARERGLYVMVDGKRGDIGSTSEAYSAAWLGRVEIAGEKLPVYDADALTVNPYLGSDNLDPFLRDCKEYDKMVFVLCRTSNRSSADVQELLVGDRPLWRVIAEQCERAGAGLAGQYGYSNVAIVAGATQPAVIRALRQRHAGMFFLVPGYGAQGGRGQDVSYAFDQFGRGAIVNNSRGITCAWQKTGKPLADAAIEAALAMKADLTKYISII